MFKDKSFRVRDIKEVLEDLDSASKMYPNVDRVFLADGDALVLSNGKLRQIMEKIYSVFHSSPRISVYGAPRDVLNKTDEEMKELAALGLGIIYIGAESGSDKVLKQVKKNATRAEIIESIKKIEKAGIAASVTFISGLAGKDYEEHAIMSAKMINESMPSYASLLTLMLDQKAPIYDDVQTGRFELLSPVGVLEETLLFLQNIEMPGASKTVFRSNHASNYVSLRGDLPVDKDIMIEQIKGALANQALIKDERFRFL
jgi:radical SAM superfamily enzyme YgiQ (UPF0313 family)